MPYCCALRLARFNAQIDAEPAAQESGLPDRHSGACGRRDDVAARLLLWLTTGELEIFPRDLRRRAVDDYVRLAHDLGQCRPMAGHRSGIRQEFRLPALLVIGFWANRTDQRSVVDAQRDGHHLHRLDTVRASAAMPRSKRQTRTG
jgi:hypothetical protein